MNFNELLNICNPVSVSSEEPGGIGKLRQDSRLVQPGDVFIAVKGFTVDGHLFIDEAIENGASVVICEESVSAGKAVCTVKVENSRALVGLLAQAFEGNPAKALKVVGITGTNGKTTVATLAYQALQTLGERASLLGTVAKRINDEEMDSRLTTSDPIELARDMHRMVEARSNYLVMEVSSHALDQQRVNGIDFEVAAFTNLSHDHLDYHSDLHSYARAKKRLFDGLNEQAAAILNADDEHSNFMAEDCTARLQFFGFNAENGIPCSIIQSSHNGITVKIEDTEIQSPLVGRFNAYNVAEAFLICRALGFEEAAIAEALKTATGAAGRLQRVQLKDRPLEPTVLVDYAHTPGALENVLQTLVHIKAEHQRLHLVFGCGGDRDKSKRAEMAAIAEQYADRVIITSDNPRSEDPNAIINDAMQGFTNPDKIIRITDRAEAIKQTISKADDGTIILIAGKGHETYQEIDGQRHPFDDREIARGALEKRNGNPKTPEVC